MKSCETRGGPNPFLEYQGEWAEDTGYLNLRGREVHVTLEGDVEASRWRIFEVQMHSLPFLGGGQQPNMSGWLASGANPSAPI